MTNVETLLAAFDGVNARSPAAIMACWAIDGTYDNPMVGPPATGYADVRQCMADLVAQLANTRQTLVVGRVTPGDEGHVVAEWHVAPPDGRRGVHVAEFDDSGKLRRVTVYPRRDVPPAGGS